MADERAVRFQPGRAVSPPPQTAPRPTTEQGRGAPYYANLDNWRRASNNPAPAPVVRSGNIQAPAAPTTSAPRSMGPINWRDAAYNAQIAAIQRALQDFETGAQTKGERYGQDFSTGLQRLGYRSGEGFQAMPNVLEMLGPQGRLAPGQAASEMVNLPGVQGGMFDIEGQFDPYSAAAQGTRGTRDDFAGRGMLRSSDFAKNFGEFQSRLNQQLEAMETGRTRFGEDLVTDVSRERSAAQDRREAAQRDAMMRAAIAAASQRGF